MDKAGVLQCVFRALVTQYAGWGNLGLFYPEILGEAG